LIAAALHAVVPGAPAAAQAAISRGTRPPTVAGAAAFMARAESVLNDLAVKAERADWVANTYITFDSEELTAQAQEAYGGATRDRYARFVTLANAGARGLGFADVGVMWRAGYDMPADVFVREIDRLWDQLKPLYLQLHAYVRARLVERYGASVAPPNGMIPAHLLGNLWAQDWENIYDILAPSGVPPSVDLTGLLVAHRVDERGMVRYGERFYTSLGFDSLPATFWERSMITKPRDRDVVCHASAWDIDGKDDLRVKLITRVTGEDFVTIHHELGHNFYQRAYTAQPSRFQNGA